MISFRHKTNSKRIKIRTNKRLDERMSAWLQKVFAIKNQIIGFKHDNKYYDVETFYLLIDKFYNSQVEIVEGTDQIQISFTSDNLNSSSFIRPSQPTSEINHIAPSSDSADDVIFVPDMKAFESRLSDSRDISVYFDIHPGFRKQIVESAGELNSFSGAKATIYVMLNNSAPKKSNFSIYVGRTCVVMIPLTTQYRPILKGILSRWRKTDKPDQGRAVKQQAEDEAPSFTTYHLQQRLNQEACLDYLGRMNVDRLLSNYEYHKLVEKLDDNFNDFYKIFCEGVIDNDYDSFKTEIRSKVENNLEMLLSNVEDMDLSRPISREEQRRQNLRKSVPDIEIVKVQNYFEVLDQIRDRLDARFLGQIKQQLLEENEQICGYFAQYLSRDIAKEQLSRKLTIFARERSEDTRPISRCVPRDAVRAKSSQHFNVKKEQVRDELGMEMGLGSSPAEEAPMFGSLPKQVLPSSASPIKNMSDIESNYKQAWDRLAKFSEFFAPEEYGLLYHYLQTHDDSISNLVQQLDKDEPNTLKQLKNLLRQKISQLMNENFSEVDLAYLEASRNNPNISYIFQNFKYECDVTAFLATLKEELTKARPVQAIMHKNSSDSQLLDNNKKMSSKRKYSDENNQEQQISPSPKASDQSLFQRGSDFSLYNFKTLAHPWSEQFEQMLKFCDFREQQKQAYLRQAYAERNPSIFLWVREFIKNKQNGAYSADYFRTHIQKKEYEQRGVMKALPVFSELMRELEAQGSITLKMRKWAVFSFMELHLPLLAAFELYLVMKDEPQFVDSLKLAFENDNKDMEYYRCFLARIEVLLREMSVHNEVSLEMFRRYPDQIRSIVEVFYFTGNCEDMMESLDMLEAEHVRKSKVSVATLNFSGINTNPFEYDDGSVFFEKINQNVRELIAAEFPDLKDWKLGKIDKDYSGNRLSVGFNSEMQLKDGRLLNNAQFSQIWMRRYIESGIGDKLKPKEEEIALTIKMDYLFYRALLREVYQLPSFQQLEQKLKTLDGGLLGQFLTDKFNRPASKLNVKEDMVVEYLLKQKLDLLCLQEAGTIDWKEELMPAYAVYKNHDSVLIYNRQKFGSLKNDLMKQYGDKLDFNKDTAFLFTDKNYLLISAHLKSKKEIYLKQAKEMFDTLRQIRTDHPLLKIVLGMDSNHFVDATLLYNEQEQQLFFMVPTLPEKPTTVKKRSFMQAQYSKAGVEVSEVKDHVACSREIVQSSIQAITGEESSNALLPNDTHPYDHYIVYAVAKFV